MRLVTLSHNVVIYLRRRHSGELAWFWSYRWFSDRPGRSRPGTLFLFEREERVRGHELPGPSETREERVKEKGWTIYSNTKQQAKA